MKRKFIFLPLIFTLTSLSLIACGSSEKEDDKKAKLTYGSYIPQESYGIHKDKGGYLVEYGDLESRMQSDENMLLTIYPGDDSNCGCWLAFKAHLKRFIDITHYKVYTISYDKVPTNNEYGFSTFNDKESFYIIKDGKVAEKVVYGDPDGPKEIFESDGNLKKFVDLHFLAPNIYDIDETCLKDISTKDANIYFSRNDCGDCKAINPWLYDYFENNETLEKLYYFDMHEIYVASKDFQPTEQKPLSPYEEFKEHYGLSEEGNHKFGYSTGFVPTLQIRKNGQIKDAIVSFNDKILKNENDEFYVADSYFTYQRLIDCKFLEEQTEDVAVLKDKVLPKEDVMTYQNGSLEVYIWSREKATIYHKPLLEFFLNYYF